MSSPELAETLDCSMIFKQEDDGMAPKLALRLMQVMGAQPAPA